MTRVLKLLIVPVLIGFALAARMHAASALGIVICAPGQPSNTEEAQATMDGLARGIERLTGRAEGSVKAAYYPELEVGLARLADPESAIAMIPLPFFLRYREELGLEALARVVEATGREQVWSLVARRGALGGPAALAGSELWGLAGYAPQFVRRVALSAWGRLPDDVKFQTGSRVVSALRRAAQGERVAVLLDTAQTAALEQLPFASELEVVARSEAMPSSLVCAIRGRLSADERREVTTALTGFHEKPEGRELLDSVRLIRFEPLEPGALDGWIARFEGSGEPRP